MKNFLIKTGLYFIVVFLFANLVAWSALYLHRNGSLYKPSFLLNNFESCSAFDYIVLGGSTGLCTVNTNLIDSVTGLNGLNLSEDDTGAGSYLLMLKFFLGKGYKTKKVILTVDPGRVNFAEKGFSNNDFRIIPYIGNPIVYDHFRERENKGVRFRSLSKYFPIFSVAYYNQELFYSSLLAFKNPDARHRFDAKGNFQYPDRQSLLTEEVKQSIDSLHFDNTDIAELDSICSTNGIQLIYYLNPVFNTISSYTDSSKIIINHRGILDSAACFYDRVHTNGMGSKEASMALALELIKIQNTNILDAQTVGIRR